MFVDEGPRRNGLSACISFCCVPGVRTDIRSVGLPDERPKAKTCMFRQTTKHKRFLAVETSPKRRHGGQRTPLTGVCDGLVSVGICGFSASAPHTTRYSLPVFLRETCTSMLLWRVYTFSTVDASRADKALPLHTNNLPHASDASFPGCAAPKTHQSFGGAE